MNLRIPGPTPLPPEVIEAVGQQMINHRGPEFEAMFRETTDWLKLFFETENDVYILTASGTGGMEAAIVNTLSPGERVLAVSIGAFGDRFAQIADAYGADVTRLTFPMGQAADPRVVAAQIAHEDPYAAVLLTQNETSTGVTNDMEALCDAIYASADPAPLVLVDGISGLGAIRLRTDDWGCDVVVAGSQKAWMAPPGLAMVSFSQRAWKAYEGAKMPRFYFDLGSARKYAQRNQTPATPNLAALYGLHTSLRRMAEEGLEAIVTRHQQVGGHCRRGLLNLGLGLFADPEHFSNTITAVRLGQGTTADQVLETLRTRHDVICASSKAPGVEMIRIGHMGYVTESDIEHLLAALRELALN